MAMMDTTLRKPRRKTQEDGSLAGRAYQLILDQILRGTLPLGAAISRRNLAEEFRMSLFPVSLALQRLEVDGLLESRPRAGTRVKIPSEEEVRDRFEMREALECHAARRCAERMTLEERLDLKRSAEHVDILFDRVSSEKSDKEFIFAVEKYHNELHLKIAQNARSNALHAAIESNHVLDFRWLYTTTTGRPSLPSGFHRELINAITSGDPQKADAAMRAHIWLGFEDVLRVVASIEGQRWRQDR
jgi:GntR family transcriptional regulator, rspAB operon transcriptional repressor